MSQKSEEVKATIMKSRAYESKKANFEKNETKVEIHVGPSDGASVTGKKSVTKMKSFKKIIV